MYTIKNNVVNTLIVKNSKFICCLYKVYTVDDINNYLNSIKIEYRDASHYCYAYIIDDKKKFSDDNEPGGTAGSPMLQVLEKRDLNYILCIVVRYFGGIKLGAGGLVRAYSKSVSNCIDNVDIIKLIKGKNIDIIFNYDKVNEIDNILKNCIILNKEFGEFVKYNVNVDNDVIEKLTSICEVSIIKEILIEVNN